MGPSLRSNKPYLGDVREVLREGEDKGMPGYSNLTTLDIQNLTAYFCTLRTTAEPTFTHRGEAIPTR